MKKLIFLLALVLCLGAVSSAQTVVTEDQVITLYGATGDTLNLADVLQDDYYIDDFSVDAELFWDLDSVAGDPNVTVLFAGSYDNSNWITINSTSLDIAVGDTTFVQSSGTYLYPYLRVQATAITDAQTTKYKYVLVIRKN